MSSSKPAGKPPEDDRAVSALARYVRHAVRSTHEARAYLQRLDTSPERVTSAIRIGVARGDLNDAACARLWAEQWARQGYAWAMIRERLRAKGLDEAAVAAGARAIGAPESDAERARAWIHARHPARADAQEAPGRARLSRLLSARGFDSELIEQVVNETAGHPAHER